MARWCLPDPFTGRAWASRLAAGEVAGAGAGAAGAAGAAAVTAATAREVAGPAAGQHSVTTARA